MAFNVTSNPEVVKIDKTGFLVDYPDCEKFAQKTQELIENEALRKKFGEEGYKTVIREFELKERITELEDYLQGK